MQADSKTTAVNIDSNSIDSSPSEADQVIRLKKLYELSMTLAGDPMEVFRHVARIIGELLDVKVVCLSEVKGSELYFLAVYVDGQIFSDAGQCSLEITPCATVEQSKDFRVYDRVVERFPEAKFLAQHNAFSYCGFPALDNNGNVVAVTCLLDDKPHNFTTDDEEILRIFGQRIGMEIERHKHIQARKEAEQKLEFLAYHDALTGLPNRLLAKDHYKLAVSFADREQNKVALIFLDLDNFKVINDSLGHLVGDTLLKMVAARLKECLRDTDTLSRQGGDEFLIVAGGVTDLDAIADITEKILVRLAKTFIIEGNELSTSLSMGISVYPDDGKDYDTLLKKADTAMYQSKDGGRNTYRFFTEQINVDAIDHLQIRNNQRKGLERGEFILHYQPQIDLSSNAVIGAEALIRWNQPESGMVLPGRFISIAEDTGLIVPIGEWALLEACRQAVAWRAAGLPEMVMAVNISAVQFKRGDLEQSVIHALSISGLNPALLELELTESILIQDTERVLATIQRLKVLGVKLSIDDFGTGYSSLSYLKRFAVDKLKIDQSFVRDMSDDPNDAVIVRTIIQMAKSLNLKTIAEGVETKHQDELLRLQHCDEVQGYHFARPMPADEFARYLSAWQSALPG